MVGAFINMLSSKWPSNAGSGEEPVVPGPITGQSYDKSDVMGEEDDEAMVETLHEKLKEMETEHGTQSPSVSVSSLLLQVQVFVTKVRELKNILCKPC